MAASARLELLLYVAYLLIGPVLWVCFGLALFMGRKRMRLTKLSGQSPSQTPPEVTILIPAKDEGERIRDCIQSALNQDYSRFSVIAIDDRSTDATGAVMDQLAASNPHLRVIHIQHGSLPAGWTGKCNALYTAVGQTQSEWLLFVDSDVILQPNALATTILVAEGRRYDLVSLLPRLECHSFWESLLVPLAGTALSMLYLVALTNLNNRPTAFANGQFILVRRSAYDAIGGHAAVRDQFCEDIEMARLLKSTGWRPRISWGAELAAVRMYSSLPSILRGWARIFFAGSFGRPWRILLGIVFILFCVFSAYAALGWGAWRWRHSMTALGQTAWLSAGAVHWALMTLFIAISYSWTGNARRNALLLPLGAGMLLGIFARSLWMGLSGNVEWRGTRYTRAARKGRLTSATPADRPTDIAVDTAKRIES